MTDFKLYRIKNYDRHRTNQAYEVVAENVIGETNRSYIIEFGYNKEIRVNKKTLLGTPDYSGISEQFFLSEQDAKEYLWLDNNKYKILEKLRNSKDIKLYKYISEQLGD